MCGSAGSTHELKIPNNAVSNLLCLLLKTLFWVFSKPLHWIIRRRSKDKGILEQSNIGLHLLTCSFLLLCLLTPALFICNAPESLVAKAHHSHNITADPLGILTEKTQLNLFGSGYVTLFTRILKDGRAQVFTPARKSPTKRKINPSSTRMILILLLLLSGDIHLNPGPLYHSEGNPTVQNIIPLQSETSAVITTNRPVPRSSTSTQLTLTLVPDGVCHGGDGKGAALGSCLAVGRWKRRPR